MTLALALPRLSFSAVICFFLLGCCSSIDAQGYAQGSIRLPNDIASATVAAASGTAVGGDAAKKEKNKHHKHHAEDSTATIKELTATSTTTSTTTATTASAAITATSVTTASATTAATAPASKIAFLFMTRGPMPLEDVWREFFSWRSTPDMYSIYVHPHAGYKYPPTSIYYKREVYSAEKAVSWGRMSQVRAMRDLVAAAMKDPLNHWFCLMSEADIPLVPLFKWRNIMLANSKSIVNACWMDPAETERESRWKPGLDEIKIQKSSWRKSANWFALIRSHAQIFVESQKFDIGWENVMCVDEHFLPTILAHLGLDNETTCTDGLAHVNWPNLMAMHPKMYSPGEISPELFAYFEKPVGLTRGFSQQCSGFPELCHFTARKFGGNSRLSLLEHIDMILSTDDHMYTGDPHRHQVNMVRKTVSADGAVQLYLLSPEQGVVRAIDNTTLAARHIAIAHTDTVAILSPEDLLFFKMGDPVITRPDGMLLKPARQREIYVMKAGRRHAVPDWDTFIALGFEAGKIQAISHGEMEEIPLGNPLSRIASHSSKN